MGQKTSANGVRLVTTQKHSSEWYAPKSKYPILIEEDYFIREKIDNSFKEFFSFSKVVCISLIRFGALGRKTNKKRENYEHHHPILNDHF